MDTFEWEEVMARTTSRSNASRTIAHVGARKGHSQAVPSMPIRLNPQAIMTFVAEMQKSVAELHVAVQKTDAATIRRIAHYLHGAAAFVDAPEMVQICRTLESLATSGDLSHADDLLTALEIEAAWIWVELNDRFFNSQSET